MASHQVRRRVKLDLEALEIRAVPALLADLPICDPVAGGDDHGNVPICNPDADFPWTDADPVLWHCHAGEYGDWGGDWTWDYDSDWYREEDWDWSEDADWYWEDEDWWWGSEDEWDDTSDPGSPEIPPDPGTLPWLWTEPGSKDRWYVRPMMPTFRRLVVIEVSEGVEPWVVTTFADADGDLDGPPGWEPPSWDEYPGEGSAPWDGIGDDEGDGEIWASSFLEMPDVAVQVIGPSGTVPVGRKVVFTIVVSNRGTVDAQQINLLIGLPSKTGFLSVSSEVGLTKNGRTLTGTLDHLGGGEKIEITVTLRAARRVGSFALTASASSSSPDEDLSNNTAVGYYYTRYAGRPLMGADLLTLLLRDRRKGS